VLFCAAIGAVSSLFVAGRVIGRLGARRTALVTGLVMAAAQATALLWPSVYFLMFACLFFGTSMSIYDVAINAEGTALDIAEQAARDGGDRDRADHGIARIGLGIGLLRLGEFELDEGLDAGLDGLEQRPDLLEHQALDPGQVVGTQGRHGRHQAFLHETLAVGVEHGRQPVLLGREVVRHEHLPDLRDVGDVALDLTGAFGNDLGRGMRLGDRDRQPVAQQQPLDLGQVGGWLGAVFIDPPKGIVGLADAVDPEAADADQQRAQDADEDRQPGGDFQVVDHGYAPDTVETAQPANPSTTQFARA